MKILLFLAKGFETMEASVFIDVIGWAGNDYKMDLEVITCGKTGTVISAFGVPVTVDALLHEINASDYDALALGHAGILFGKKATTYHLGDGRRQKQLEETGAEVVNEPVVITDNIITSYCPQTAPEVAFSLLEMLVGPRDMLIVKKAMGF